MAIIFILSLTLKMRVALLMKPILYYGGYPKDNGLQYTRGHMTRIDIFVYTSLSHFFCLWMFVNTTWEWSLLCGKVSNSKHSLHRYCITPDLSYPYLIQVSDGFVTGQAFDLKSLLLSWSHNWLKELWTRRDINAD